MYLTVLVRYLFSGDWARLGLLRAVSPTKVRGVGGFQGSSLVQRFWCSLSQCQRVSGFWRLMLFKSSTCRKQQSALIRLRRDCNRFPLSTVPQQLSGAELRILLSFHHISQQLLAIFSGPLGPLHGIFSYNVNRWSEGRCALPDASGGDFSHNLNNHELHFLRLLQGLPEWPAEAHIWRIIRCFLIFFFMCVKNPSW